MNSVTKFISNTADKPWKVLLLITAVILIVYFPIFQNSFITSYDDGDFFVQWEEIKSLNNIPLLLSGNLPMKHQHVYRPMRSIMQAIVYQTASGHTLAYHLFALLTYIACTYLVFAIIKNLRDKDTGLIAALIFAVLPVHVESITFITASFDTAGILFILLSLHLYLLNREKNKLSLCLASIIFALFSFFTYDFALVLPLLIILYEIILKRLPRKQWLQLAKHLIPYLIAEALYLFIKYAIIGQSYFGSFFHHIPLGQRLMTAAKSFIQYIYYVSINYPLSIYHKVGISTSLADFYMLAALLGIAGYLALAWLLYKNLRIYSFLMLWFLISLLPVANIVEIASYMSERYLFLASLGWAALIGVLFTSIHSSQKTTAVRLAAPIVLICLFLGYASLSWTRNREWRNDITFWTTAIARQPDHVDAYINLAFYYSQEEKNNEKAIPLLKKALELDPDNALAFGNVGLILFEQKQYGKAIVAFNKALETETNNASFYLTRGLSYHNLGKTEEAIKDYREALRLYPHYYEANFNLAALSIEAGRYDDAILLFTLAVRLRPQDYESYYGLGRAYAGKKDFPRAREFLDAALKINPAFTPALELRAQL